MSFPLFSPILFSYDPPMLFYMTRPCMMCILLILLLPSAVHALVTESGDHVVLNQPIDDDIIAAGGKVAVNAPVHSLIAAGGEIEINAPVEGDVIAAGGTVTLNAPVSGKVLLAGGAVTLNSSVGRNVLVHAGEVSITRSVTVGADALVSASRVSHQGEVKGNLTVSSEEFISAGTERHLAYTRDNTSLGRGLLGILSLALILFSLGMAVLGLLAIWIAPAPYMGVEARVRSRPLVNILTGLGGILGGIVLGVLLALTVVGLPLAICILMVLLAGLLFSTLFVSSSIGCIIAERLGWHTKAWQQFLIGFVILQIAFRIPYIGLILLAVCVCLGFGAFIFGLSSCRHHSAG
ncbi:MAG: hypothetical protein A4E40_01567 [Methanoregulaceae archaeon PtaU1.Bin059]|nr:MAG: hypothetical protein A4E39_01832 [Methanoregulaceae archaeon PtaB.Bin152]OPY35994.1 MAG: hypothetical protein A4E40_01567 [Methanoregulaceae archaeon PtaU1.Bin059]